MTPPNPPPPHSTHPLPPEITITPITPTTLPAYRRLITLLLPIRYPDKFYKDSVANPTSSSLALGAVWTDTLNPGKRKRQDGDIQETTSLQKEAKPKVIAGIQCRLEPLPLPPSSTPPTTIRPTDPPPQPYALYIQTLATLAPYRSLGIATALLDCIIHTAITHYSSAGKNSNVTEVYAHVWEANEEALEWYVRRGFEVQGVVEGYYTKLRPGGARVVRRRVGVGDWVRVQGMAGAEGVGIKGGEGDEGMVQERGKVAGG